MKIRLGEWDAAGNEIIPYQEFNVVRIFLHPSYNPSTLSNSIAILRLSPVVPIGQSPAIIPACLSGTSDFISRHSYHHQSHNFNNAGTQVSGMRCWVSGWGASAFNTVPTQTIQTHVDVPLVDQTTCQTKLRTTKLGSGFVLDNSSFMCAGGEAGKGEKLMFGVLFD